MSGTYTIEYSSSRRDETKEEIREARKACSFVEKVFNKAYRKLIRYLKKHGGFDNEPNNYYDDNLNIIVRIDKENLDHYGGAFCPDDNIIVINKYVMPISSKSCESINLFKNKKSLEHILIHELIHYAFTEYTYGKGKKPKSWVVGLCSPEDMHKSVEKGFDKIWGLDEWLDEALTEYLAMNISGKLRKNALLHEENIS